MLLVIGYMLCAYFIIKGLEIYNNAKVSDPAKQTDGQKIAGLILVICILLAVLFGIWLTRQAHGSRDIPASLIGVPSAER